MTLRSWIFYMISNQIMIVSTSWVELWTLLRLFFIITTGYLEKSGISKLLTFHVIVVCCNTEGFVTENTFKEFKCGFEWIICAFEWMICVIKVKVSKILNFEKRIWEKFSTVSIHTNRSFLMSVSWFHILEFIAFILSIIDFF